MTRMPPLMTPLMCPMPRTGRSVDRPQTPRGEHGARRKPTLPGSASPVPAVLLPLLLLLTAALAGPARPALALGGTILDARPVESLLPGPLVDAALVHRRDGATLVAVLVGPPVPPDEDNAEDAEDAEQEGDDTPDRNQDQDRDGDRDRHEAAEDGASAEQAPRLRTLLLIDPRTGTQTLLAEGLPQTARRLATLSRPDASGKTTTDLLVVTTSDGSRLIDPDDPSGAPSGGRGTRSPEDPAGTEVDADQTLTGSLGLGAATVLAPKGLDDVPDGASAPRRPLAVARPGQLTLVEAALGTDSSPDRAKVVAAGGFPLPKRAKRTRWGVRITSPEVHRVVDGTGTSGSTASPAPPCWAIGPEVYGKRRLRTLLDCLGPDGQPADAVEAWSLLPGEETVTKTVYTRYRDRPVLLVLTRDKLGLFVKQRLRAFPLDASRTRVGTAPILAADTVCPIWHDSSLGFADVDGDGRDDLYLVCQKGLIDQELRLEVYSGTDAGGLEPRVRDVELDGDFGSWLFGRDWTGDGLPDLLAVRDGAIELHPGTGKRRPIERHPLQTATLETANEADRTEMLDTASEVGEPDRTAYDLGSPRILGAADLDGDQQPELVIYRNGKPGGMLVILDRTAH